MNDYDARGSRGHPGDARLLDRVRAAIRARHYSRRTEESYVHWIKRFVLFSGRRHPRELGRMEVTAFLSDLAEARDRKSTRLNSSHRT